MKCLGQARSTSAPDKVKHLSLKLLYMITKVKIYPHKRRNVHNIKQWTEYLNN